MGVVFGETGVFCRIKASIHTGQDCEMAARRQRQIAFVPEILCVFGVCSQHFIQDLGHCPASCSELSQRVSYQENMCRAEPAFPSSDCPPLRSCHTSATVRPCPNPTQVQKPHQ